MSVTIREYVNGGLEVDIRFTQADGTRVRERVKSPFQGKSATRRWAEARERELMKTGKPSRQEKKEVPVEHTRTTTLREFAPRFITRYAKANREKPSAIAGKESILRCHLIPRFGDVPLEAITTEAVQQLKADLSGRAA